MSKKNIASNVANESAQTNRMVYSPEQFLDKAAATSFSNICNRNNNFQYLEITDAVVENKNLSSTEFHFSKLSNVRFENCDFSSTEFKGTEFNNVSFVHCQMERAYFNFAQLNGISFSECFLDSAEFDFASGKAVFAGCSMENTEFPMSTLELTFIKCNLNRAELNGIRTMKLHAKGSDFTCAEFNDCTMEGSAENCIFVSTEFYGTNGNKFNFMNCKLRRLSTEGATGIEEKYTSELDENLDEELEKILQLEEE